MTRKELLEKSSRTLPSQRQYEWMQMGLTAFVHFSLNTFYGREWGNGTESLEMFNPRECDPESWAAVLAENGFKLAVLTCKHHGGFCLWPSAYTEYSVKNTPWKEGKGDIVKEFSDACRKYGIRFGVYLSPWDRHDPRYANDSQAYNEYFLNQLTELLTNYGEVHEVWFDGACVPVNGKLQEYDWEGYYSLIRRLQPKAVISGIAPDVRWCGNEAGRAREAEWAVINMDRGYYAFNRTRCGKPEVGELGENPVWYPAEVDTSIRPNWFYHKCDDVDVKSLHKLLNIYFNSVGHNAVLLLNIPPDCEGRFHPNDIARLQEFHKWLEEAFREDLAEKGTLEKLSEKVREDDLTGEVLELHLPAPQTFNCLELAEDIANYSQRVESYRILAKEGTRWQEIASGRTVGFRELKRTISPVTTDTLQFHFVSRAPIALLPPKLYLIPEIPAEEAAPANLYYWKCTFSIPEGQGGDLSLLQREGAPYTSDPGPMPQSLTGTPQIPIDIQGIVLLPQQDGSSDGVIKHCSCEISYDGINWETVLDEELGNFAINPVYRKFLFQKVCKGVKALRLNVLDTFDGTPYFKIHSFMPILASELPR